MTCNVTIDWKLCAALGLSATAIILAVKAEKVDTTAFCNMVASLTEIFSQEETDC